MCVCVSLSLSWENMKVSSVLEGRDLGASGRHELAIADELHGRVLGVQGVASREVHRAGVERATVCGEVAEREKQIVIQQNIVF